MEKLNIKKFASGGGETFEVYLSYTENYDQQGNCISVTVLANSSFNIAGVDKNGKDVSTAWGNSFPATPIQRIYTENTTETLTFISIYGDEWDETITINSIQTVYYEYASNAKVSINPNIKIDSLSFGDIETILNTHYSIGSVYETTDNTFNPNTLFPGDWTLLSSNVIDTGWQNYSWTNSTYIGTTQSSYTLNKWRIVDNVLHVVIGAACTSTINHGNEDEIARIPISNTGLNNGELRIWTGAVGGAGAVAGFMLRENTNGLSVGIKPHTSSQFATASWYSTFFTYPLPNNFVFNSGNYKRKYIWERTA